MRIRPSAIGLCAIALFLSHTSRTMADTLQPGDPAKYDVVWDSPSTRALDSMPLGNGDVALNAWVDPHGDLLLLLAKSDAMSENGEFLKLGRVRVKLDPPLPVDVTFSQRLRLRDGLIDITAGANEAVSLRIWVDANRPEIHVDARSAAPIALHASMELWRTHPQTLELNPKTDKQGFNHGFREFVGGPPITIDADTVLPAANNQAVWLHRNERSFVPDLLKQQHLEALIGKYPDPYLHRTFGCLMRGPGLISDGDLAVKSAQPANEQHLSIACLTAQTESAEAWRSSIEKIAGEDDKASSPAAFEAHTQWWRSFWERSWIELDGTPAAEQVSSGYALQRFMMACGSRGPLPQKFNGGLFTVGRFFVDPADPTKQIEDPDWRAWGAPYWFQNNRHLYWPLIASGDGDLMKPWFEMYTVALPLVTDKTHSYWHHGGAAFQETIFSFGLPCMADFGWNNPKVEMTNPYIGRYWSGGIEMTLMMLSQYQHTGDVDFAKNTLLPFADATTAFFDEHWPRDAGGKIHFEPSQSLETYQHGVTNPLPEIAGLKYVLPQLLDLPKDLATDAQRQRWARTLADLPPIPIGPGKDGQPVLKPAEQFKKTGNVENPELYAVYPYRLYGFGLADLDLAKRTYAERLFKTAKCWSQDPIDAAFLGLADEAAKQVTENFTNSGSRFQAFWKPANDWIPDLDNGGAGMQALQWMLMQCDGQRIQLLPAWPAEWSADFKLHAPDQTVITASVRQGKIAKLDVSPKSREKDVVIVVALPSTQP